MFFNKIIFAMGCLACSLFLAGIPLWASGHEPTHHDTEIQETTSHGNAHSGNGLGISLEATVATQYIWHGFDEYDGDGGFHPKLEVDLFGSGFVVEIARWSALTSGHVDNAEIEYGLAYHNHFFSGPLTTAFHAHYIYFDYHRLEADQLNKEEIAAGLSWPNLLLFGESALIPSYTVYRVSPGASGSDVSEIRGFLHRIAVAYDLKIPGFPSDINAFADINYNDGMGGHAHLVEHHHEYEYHVEPADHCWSHATIGISSDFKIGLITIKPAVNYQISMDDSVNEEDEFWGSLTVGIHF